MTLDEALRVLGLEADATLDDVEQACRVLARSLHPDNNPVPGAELRFMLVEDACRVARAELSVRDEQARARGEKVRQQRAREEREAKERAQRKREQRRRAERERQEKAQQEQQDWEAYAYYQRGEECIELGQYTDAIKNFDIAIGFKSNYAEAYNNRGWAKYKLGQYAVAIADFDEAIRLKPDYADAYNNLGMATEAERKQQEALANAEKRSWLTFTTNVEIISINLKNTPLLLQIMISRLDSTRIMLRSISRVAVLRIK